MRPKRSIATVCLSGTLPDKLEAAAAAGFDAVEIFENDLLTYEGTAAEAGRMCSDLGLEVALFQPFRDFESMPEPQRARNLDRAERKFDTMEQLGAPDGAGVLQRPGRGAAGARARRRRPARDGRARRPPLAPRGLRGAGLGQARQPLAAGLGHRAPRRPPGARPHPRQLPHPARSATICAGSPMRCRRRSCSSSSSPTRRACPWTRSPGAGTSAASPARASCPSPDFLRDVLAAGYRGPLSLEIFNDEFRSAPARRIARDGLRSLVWAEEGAGIAALPARPVLSGIEFVEFAVDDAARGRARRLLGTPRLPPRRPAPLQGGDAAPQRRRQPRAERRAGQRRLRALRAARPLRLRHGLPGGRPGARAGAGRSDAPPHLARAHGRGRAAHPGDPRAGRHADLPGGGGGIRRAPDLGGRLPPRTGRGGGRGAPAASAAWTTWRRP